MAEYRELRKDEAPPVGLWTEVFGVEAPFFTSLLEGGTEEDNVSLAAFEDGRIVSSVHVFMRRIRDRDGKPLKVGGIGSVSTHPEHRKHGHSGRLLELALAAMAREGCVWSFLGTGVNDHYARYGWRTVSTPESGGELRIDAEGEAAFLTPDDATLATMAPLYGAETATRPMATVRTERTWQTAIRYRLDSKHARIAGYYEGERLSAYAVARFGWGSWGFVEAAGDASRLPSLFGALARQVRESGTYRVGLALPPASSAFAAAATTVSKVVAAESRGMMLRPIADRIAWPDLFALYGDPRGRHGELDAF